tara:strand:- start:4953 stop:5432 length:480 start_codon:yes stop_codon:yes gene_type:complete
MTKTAKKLSPWIYPGIKSRDRLRALNALTSLSVDLSKYLDVCSLAFDTTRDNMTGRDRHHECVLARHAFSKIVRDRTTLTLHAIGKYINRDHSTIKHSYNQAEDLIETYPYFKDRYEMCLKMLNKIEVVKDAGNLQSLSERLKLIKNEDDSSKQNGENI